MGLDDAALGDSRPTSVPASSGVVPSVAAPLPLPLLLDASMLPVDGVPPDVLLRVVVLLPPPPPATAIPAPRTPRFRLPPGDESVVPVPETSSAFHGVAPTSPSPLALASARRDDPALKTGWSRTESRLLRFFSVLLESATAKPAPIHLLRWRSTQNPMSARTSKPAMVEPTAIPAICPVLRPLLLLPSGDEGSLDDDEPVLPSREGMVMMLGSAPSCQVHADTLKVLRS